MRFTTTADGLTLVLLEGDGEIADGTGRVVAGLRSEDHLVEGDRHALSMYFDVAPEMVLAAWKRRWPRVRARARKVLGAGGALTEAIVRHEALR